MTQRRRPRIRNAKLLAEMATQGFNNTALASRAGLAPATLSQALNLRVEPSPATVAALCAVLRRSPAQLGLAVREVRDE